MLPVQVTKPGGRVVGLRIPPDQQAAADQGITAILQATEVTAERLNRLREHVDEGLVAPYVAQTFELSDVSRFPYQGARRSARQDRRRGDDAEPSGSCRERVNGTQP